MDELVRYEQEGDVAVLRMDDGKVNVLGHAMIEALSAGLDRAEREAKVVLILGRPGKFSAGFDLQELGGGPARAEALLRSGFGLLTRIYGFPQPVVIGCSGHALAAGALLLLAADLRVGCEGPFKIGLNETAIGMYLPILPQVFAGDRIDSRFQTRATLLGEIFGPQAATEAGYLDLCVKAEVLEATALSRATGLLQVAGPHFAKTKASVRDASIERIRSTLDDDLARLSV
ncbi:MAG: crotonase/enoyl-CoA hydratase family protein [Myxococcales bacterium]|nr:crotonase/enoyl-CoA hydratase family protein [Myxococcales bacterium]